jgi:glutaredoxin-related protein
MPVVTSGFTDQFAGYPVPISKIFNAEPDCFVTFYDPNCGYSRSAIDLLKSRPDLKFKGYVIDNAGGLQSVLDYFNQYGQQLQFDPSHTTKPIIFYQNKFLGGFDQLSQYLQQQQLGLAGNNPGFFGQAYNPSPYGQVVGKRYGLDLDAE